MRTPQDQRGTLADAVKAAVALPTVVPITLARTLLPTGEPNPDFNPSKRELAADLDRMRKDRKPLDRPLVILSGYRSWPTISIALRQKLQHLVTGPIFSTSYTLHGDIDRCVQTAIRRINRVFPPEHADRTTEVDVIGVSMGGLVARRAIMPHDLCTSRGPVPPRPRLNARRVFTLGSPHRGAVLAEKIAPDHAAQDMRPGSAFLAELDQHFTDTRGRAHADGGYDLTCYAVLNDTWVGAHRTSPPGQDPHWTRGARIMSHFLVSEHPAIIADVARRLRGEEPLSPRPSEPPSA